MKNDFHKILRNRRKSLGISQEYLAKKAKIERTYMSKLESDKSNPSYSHIKKICNALGLTLAQFFGGKEETETAPAIVECYQDKMTKKLIEQYRVKAEVIPIRVVKDLDAFSRDKNVREEITAKYIYIEKAMFKHPKNIMGVEIEKDYRLSSLKLNKPIFLIDIKRKGLVNFGFYVVEMEDSGEVLIMRYEEKDNKLIFFDEKKAGLSYLPGASKVINKEDFNKDLIRGKVVGIVGKL